MVQQSHTTSVTPDNFEKKSKYWELKETNRK